jgi:hypothetical protein
LIALRQRRQSRPAIRHRLRTLQERQRMRMRLRLSRPHMLRRPAPSTRRPTLRTHSPPRRWALWTHLPNFRAVAPALTRSRLFWKVWKTFGGELEMRLVLVFVVLSCFVKAWPLSVLRARDQLSPHLRQGAASHMPRSGLLASVCSSVHRLFCSCSPSRRWPCCTL